MYITCCVCNPDKEAFEGKEQDSLRIAKYYPTSGWYETGVSRSDWNVDALTFAQDLDKFLAQHRHGDFSMWGTANRFRIGYEVEFKDGHS